MPAELEVNENFSWGKRQESGQWLLDGEGVGRRLTGEGTQGTFWSRGQVLC